jgi:hypothetical protein
VPEPPEVLSKVVPAVVRLGLAALAVRVDCAINAALDELPPPQAVSSEAVASAQADRVMRFLDWYTARPPGGLIKDKKSSL